MKKHWFKKGSLVYICSAECYGKITKVYKDQASIKITKLKVKNTGYKVGDIAGFYFKEFVAGD